jgi:DNA-binding LytR/AlgR family response regulator
MLKIIKCLIVDDEAIAREIIASHLSKIDNLEVVVQCKNAIEAFNYINNNPVDLVFLDINMPEVSGISFAKSINKDIRIIFTTAYRDYAIDGFELQAVDYLMKPISFERLLKAVTHYFEVYNKPEVIETQKNETSDYIFVRSDRRMIKVDFEDIIYIESYSDYIKIHQKEETIVTRETISALEARLPKAQFIRIHRSYIVAISQIKSFTNEAITVSDKELTISRSYRFDVLKRLE